MSDLVPADVQIPPPRAGDVRVGHLLRSEQAGARVVLLGFPSDAGVTRNGGRPGAALGPEAIRSHFYRLTPPGDARGEVRERFEQLLRSTADIGDIRCTGDLAADQAMLGESIARLFASSVPVVPIILGGGHETSYGHFLGYATTGKRVSIVNLDAHPDVRPLEAGEPHSGSPFRQAIEHPSGHCGRYVAAGLNPHSTSPEHVEWIRQCGGEVHFRSALSTRLLADLYGLPEHNVLATFDLDALDQSHAPGVSAPNAFGLCSKLWFEAARAAGQSPQVTSMDVVELSPPHDRNDQTARIAALTLWEFLLGLSQRGEEPGSTSQPPTSSTHDN